MATKITQRSKLFQGKFISLWKTEFSGTDGKTYEWEWIRGKNFVVVLPLLDTTTVLLIKNFRVPIEQYVLDVPAGTIEEGATPEETARRELTEEVGYTARKLIALPPVPHAPGNSSSMIYPFIATSLEKTRGQNLEATEDIEVVTMSVNEVLQTYRAGHDLLNLRVLSLIHVAVNDGLCTQEAKKENVAD